ncbi:uncharacterized protein [Notamacropus eugenii]|uniref:uncharacterized protein n=1 Tax=Notamacropus eugenii TaxID=9315 RepID=UPI003B6826CE
MGGGSSISIHKAKGEDGSFPEKSLLKWRSPRACDGGAGASGGWGEGSALTVTCRSCWRGLGSDRSASGSGCRPAWDWPLRGPGALGPRAASSPPLRQGGRWLGPPKASGGGSWKGTTSRAPSTPRPRRRHLLRRLPTFAASTVPAAPPAAAAATPLEAMPWRRLSALLRRPRPRGSPPGTGFGRRLEHNEFVEYTGATENQGGPAEPVKAPEAALALAVFYCAHLIPCGWVLSRMEAYRRV